MKWKWLWVLVSWLGFSGMLFVFGITIVTVALMGALVSSSSIGVTLGQEGEIPVALIPLYLEAEEQYGVPWPILAALSKVTTDFGQRKGDAPGQLGFIPFSQDEWSRYGIDGDEDGDINPQNPWDAIDTAAHFLSQSELKGDINQTIRRYNDSQAFVDDISHWSGIFQAMLPSGQTWVWPVPGFVQLSSDFGWRTDPITGKRDYHTGFDIPAPQGTPVLAVQEGTVAQVLSENNSGGYGNLVIIQHPDGLTSWYAHLSKALVTEGEGVRRGQLVGTVGSTGRVTGPHLHLEFRLHGQVINPLTVLKQKEATTKRKD